MSSTDIKKISVIIPVAPYEKCKVPVKKIRKSKFVKDVIIVTGNQPSFQRNEAVKIAKGEIIYFLDNDSIPEFDNFEKIVNFFKTHNKAAVLGGPSLSPKIEKKFPYAVGIAFSSFLGTAFSSARYAPKGKLRKSSELELILCNMAFRKNIFIKSGMFNTSLYPNEENELLNRISEAGYEIWYMPDLIVYRSHRANIFKFIKQIFTYGRGRGNQFLIEKKKMPLFPLASLLFDIYIILSILKILPELLLLIYFSIIFLFSIYKAILHRKIFLILYLPVIFFIIHSLYGLGFIYGLFKKRKNENLWFKIKK